MAKITKISAKGKETLATNDAEIKEVLDSIEPEIIIKEPVIAELTDSEKEADKQAELAREEIKAKLESGSVTFSGPKNGIVWYQGKGKIKFVNGEYTTSDKEIIKFMEKYDYKRKQK